MGDEKDKRAIVYKTKKKEEKGSDQKRKKEKEIIRACLNKLMAEKLSI